LKTFFYSAATALALCSTSCARNEHNIFPVSGKVTYDGAPAAGAAVFFTRQNRDYKDHLVMGVVQDDGSFELVCGPWGKGAPPGEYDVLIEWRPVIGQRNGNPQRAPDKLKGRYADATRPLLHAVVEAKNNELMPFEVTD
jgi:hypothetical protein